MQQNKISEILREVIQLSKKVKIKNKKVFLLNFL